MKRVLFSMVLLLVASFTFAQEKNVKEAKSIANGVNPDFAKSGFNQSRNKGQCRNVGCSRSYPKKKK